MSVKFREIAATERGKANHYATGRSQPEVDTIKLGQPTDKTDAAGYAL